VLISNSNHTKIHLVADKTIIGGPIIISHGIIFIKSIFILWGINSLALAYYTYLIIKIVNFKNF
jgi:hypothetical protein